MVGRATPCGFEAGPLSSSAASCGPKPLRHRAAATAATRDARKACARRQAVGTLNRGLLSALPLRLLLPPAQRSAAGWGGIGAAEEPFA